MHLDPRPVVVPHRLVPERRHRHVAVQFAVDPLQQVQVERRRHPRRIVIGRHQHVGRLDPVHPDQQHRPLAQRCAHRPQQVGRHQRRHVADRRSGKEPQLGAVRHRGGQRDRPHEIGLHRIHGQVGKPLRQHAGRRPQEVAGNVYRHIGGWIRAAQQDRRLGGRSRSELHHRPPLADALRDLGTDRLQDRRLGPGGIIFGQVGDLLEQLGAAPVIEPAGGDRPRPPRQAAHHIGAKCRVGQRRLTVLDLGLQHPTGPLPDARR